MSNVGFYIRLSKEDGDKSESDSINNQRKLLHQFISNKNEFNFIDEYIDDGFTGTNFNRPSFKRMLDDIYSKKIDCIIVKDLSRFGRDYIDVGQYLQKIFPQNKVRFIAINENIDSDKNKYDLMMPIKNILNEQYARDISDKVLGSLRAKQINGEFIGAFACYGYLKDPKDKSKLIIDEYASEIIKTIFELFLSGKNKLYIATYLNKQGVLCPSEYKKSQGLNYRNSNKLNQTDYWTHSTIYRILQNQMYIGNMVQHKNNRSRYNHDEKYLPQDDWIIIENTHPSIIDINTWNQVQILLKKNTRLIDFTQNISIFAGYLKCGDCGRAMAKVKRDKSIEYVCGTYKRYTTNYCSQHKVKHKDLEKDLLIVLNKYVKVIKKAEKRVEDIKLANTKNINGENLHKEIMKCELELERIAKFKKGIYEDFKMEIITKEEYLAYKDDYSKQELQITQKKETLSKKSEQSIIDILESPWVSDLKKYQAINQLDRYIVSVMVKCITIYERNKKVYVLPEYNLVNYIQLLEEFADVP